MSDDAVSGVTPPPAATDATEYLPLGVKTLLQHLNSLVQNNLDNSNYMLWKVQLMSILRATKLAPYVDGSKPCPPSTLAPAADTAAVPPLNPAYVEWTLVDDHLKSCLFASMTPQVLSQILHLNTAHEIWAALDTCFGTLSHAHIIQLKHKLCGLQKGSKTMQQYLAEVKQIIDSLSNAGQQVSDTDLVVYILRGLPPEYDSFQTTVRYQTRAVTMIDLSSMLLNEEMHLSMKSLSIGGSHPASSALAAHHQNFSAGRGNSGYYRGGGRRGGGRTNRNRSGGGGGRDSSASGARPSASTGDSVTCQICFKVNHIASECWHRFKEDYVPRQNNQAMTASVQNSVSDSVSVSNANNNSQWFLDSGANSHMTNDLSNLNSYSTYTGADSVAVGNGARLPISHSGHGRVYTEQFNPSGDISRPM